MFATPFRIHFEHHSQWNSNASNILLPISKIDGYSSIVNQSNAEQAQSFERKKKTKVNFSWNQKYWISLDEESIELEGKKQQKQKSRERRVKWPWIHDNIDHSLKDKDDIDDIKYLVR